MTLASLSSRHSLLLTYSGTAFFGLENALFGMFTIIPLWILIAATIYQFYKVSKGAAYLMAPYILWVSIATVLNTAVYLLNR